MRIHNKHYTREQILERVGNIAQVGGTRHYALAEGRGRGTAAVDVDTGAGFRFTVMPDRGLDISLASYKGTNLVHFTPNGEVHPAFYEPQGLGWLRGFFAGLLTTCGLTYLGPPGKDGNEELGLHGRYSFTPAVRVCDLSRWDGDEYRIELTGIVEESILFGNKVRLTRHISTTIGSKSLAIHDVAENFGYQTTPFTVLYHINPGFPLLDTHSKFVVTSEEVVPSDAHSAPGLGDWRDFTDPIPGFVEEGFLHTMAADADGMGCAAMINPELNGGLGLFIRFDTSTLPLLNEWKMMGQGDYVVGMEACNCPCENRAVLREQDRLPNLALGERRTMRLEIGILDGADEIAEFLRKAVLTT